jgi:hypothetical protein
MQALDRRSGGAGGLMPKLRPRFSCISLALIALLGGAGPARSLEFRIERITYNSVYDSGPRLGGDGLVVWTQLLNSFEIMSHQDGQTTRITDNDSSDMYPVAAGGRILWESGRGALSMWDG